MQHEDELEHLVGHELVDSVDEQQACLGYLGLLQSALDELLSHEPLELDVLEVHRLFDLRLPRRGILIITENRKNVLCRYTFGRSF